MRVLTVLALWAAWLALAAAAVQILGWDRATPVVVAAAVSHAVTALLAYWVVRRRWVGPLERLGWQVELLARTPPSGWSSRTSPRRPAGRVSQVAGRRL